MSTTWIPASKRLPNELWLQIFSLATFVPGALEVDHHDPFEHPISSIPFHDYDRHEMKTSISTRHALTLTCKKWYQLGIPFLYEIVIIRDSGSLRSLRTTLTTLQPNEAETQHSLGWWTQRFELPNLSSESELDTELMRDVFHAFPRLRILFLSCRKFGPWLLPDAIMDALQAPLCKLHFEGISPSRKATEALVARSALRVFLVAGADWFVDPITLLQSPALELMSFKPNIYISQKVEANPRTKYLYMPPRVQGWHTSWDFADAARNTFLAAQGVHLSTVYLAIENENIEDSNFEACAAQLVKHCPNLKHIILIIPWLWNVPFMTTMPTSVTHLGIYTVAGQARNSYWSSFFYYLSVLSDDPAIPLQVVRLLNPQSAQDIRKRVATGKEVGQRHIQRCKFRVEDWEGKELLS